MSLHKEVVQLGKNNTLNQGITSKLQTRLGSLAQWCQAAFQATGCIPEINSENDAVLWLQSTTTALSKVFGDIFSPGSCPVLLSRGYTERRDMLFELILWSCLSEDCQKLILESLNILGTRGADEEPCFYIFYIKSTVNGLCSSIKKTQDVKEPLVVLQAQYLPLAIKSCSKFVREASYPSSPSDHSDILKSFLAHIVSIKHKNVSSIQEETDLVHFVQNRGRSKTDENDGKIKTVEKFGDETISDMDKKLGYIKPILGKIMEVRALKELSNWIDMNSDPRSIIANLECKTNEAAHQLGINCDDYGSQLIMMVKFSDQLCKMDKVGDSLGVGIIVNEIHHALPPQEKVGCMDAIQGLLRHLKKIFEPEFVRQCLLGTDTVQPCHIPSDETWKKYCNVTLNAVEPESDEDEDDVPLASLKKNTKKNTKTPRRKTQRVADKALASTSTKKSKKKKKGKREASPGTPVTSNKKKSRKIKSPVRYSPCS